MFWADIRKKAHPYEHLVFLYKSSSMARKRYNLTYWTEQNITLYFDLWKLLINCKYLIQVKNSER